MAEQGKRFLIDTSPTKEAVVDGITRDATDEECIFDLIDNSIDAARNIIFRNISPKLRNELPEGYSGYEVKLHLNSTSFKIWDNCGGIAVDDLRKSALRFGERSEQSMGIGSFGVGLNRALFRLGDTAHIITDTGRQRAELTLDKEKYLETRTWTIPAESLPTANKIGTTIEIRHLSGETSKNFGEEKWVNNLRHQIGRRYGRFAKKHLAVWINSDPIQNEEIQIRENGPSEVREQFIKDDDVAIHIVYGQHKFHKFPFEKDHSEEQNRRLTTQYGWTILCNDRAVIMSDKTLRTGWDVTKFHSEFYGFVGYVNFVCRDPRKLPWKTTKTDIDLNNSAYQLALKSMRTFTEEWRSEANQRKKAKGQPASPPPKPKPKDSRSGGRSSETKTTKSKVTKPVPKQDHNQFRTVLPPDMNEVHCFDKHLALVREAKLLDMWDLPYSGLALIRMLFETSAVKFMDRKSRYEELHKWVVARRRREGSTIAADDEGKQVPSMDETLAFFHNHPNVWGLPAQNYLKHSVSKTSAHLKSMNGALHNAFQPISRTIAIQIRDEVLPLLRHLIEK
jgi:hypothetical protein